MRTSVIVPIWAPMAARLVLFMLAYGVLNALWMFGPLLLRKLGW